MFITTFSFIVFLTFSVSLVASPNIIISEDNVEVSMDSRDLNNEPTQSRVPEEVHSEVFYQVVSDPIDMLFTIGW